MEAVVSGDACGLIPAVSVAAGASQRPGNCELAAYRSRSGDEASLISQGAALARLGTPRRLCLATERLLARSKPRAGAPCAAGQRSAVRMWNRCRPACRSAASGLRSGLRRRGALRLSPPAQRHATRQGREAGCSESTERPRPMAGSNPGGHKPPLGCRSLHSSAIAAPAVRRQQSRALQACLRGSLQRRNALRTGRSSGSSHAGR